MTKFVLTKNVNMNNLSFSLKSLRLSNSKTISDLSVILGISPTLISRYESGQRRPSEVHIRLYEDFFKTQELRILWLADKIAELVVYEHDPLEIFKLAESRVEYLRSERSLQVCELDQELEYKLKNLSELREKWLHLKPLNTLQLQKMQEFFQVQYIFESNKIEGNTLSHQETAMVLLEGLTVSGKSMREHLEAINHKEAIQFLFDLVTHKDEYNNRNLLMLHQLILKSIDSENAGVYRKLPVRISGSDFVPAQPFMLNKLMEDYFIFYEYQKHLMHPVLLAAEMHERLVSIHPFIDGNGRVSRLIMNYILLKHGYPIVSLKADLESRKQYYHSLQEVQLNNNPIVFYHLIVDAVQRSLEEHLAMVA